MNIKNHLVGSIEVMLSDGSIVHGELHRSFVTVEDVIQKGVSVKSQETRFLDVGVGYRVVRGEEPLPNLVMFERINRVTGELQTSWACSAYESIEPKRGDVIEGNTFVYVKTYKIV